MKDKLTDFERVLKCLNMFREWPVYCPRNEKQNFEEFLKIIPLLKPFEPHPDAYAYGGGELLLLEHFSFDNTKEVRGGSKQRKMIAKNDKKLESLIGKGIDSPMVMEHVEKTGVDYVSNLLAQFQNHAQKIREYTDLFPSTPSQPIDRTIVGFIMEDTSTFGSQALLNINGKNERCEIYACFAKEFLDIFEATPSLDFVIYLTSRERSKGIMSFITKDTIPVYRRYQIEMSSIGHFLFEDSFAMMCDIPVNDLDLDPKEIEMLIAKSKK